MSSSQQPEKDMSGGVLDVTAHDDIDKRLQQFYEANMVPNLLFYGKNGSGKKSIVTRFVNKIFPDEEERSRYLLIMDCIHSSGIKSIREDLKFFSKTQIQENRFKVIVLLNADNLTVDAQSALRRCIETCSNTTRFFVVVESKVCVLRPLISRFCNIYVPLPKKNGRYQCFYTITKSENTDYIRQQSSKKNYLKQYLKPYLEDPGETSLKQLTQISTGLYEKGNTSEHIEEYIKNTGIPNHQEIIFRFNSYKTEIRNEELMIFYILQMLFKEINKVK